MKKSDVVNFILKAKNNSPLPTSGKIFAPSNIALCKYWGKRDRELNLPVTSSLSVSLGDRGATAEIRLDTEDHYVLNGSRVTADTAFATRLTNFLNLFRTEKKYSYNINIETNLPIAAGLASSACGFASIVKALDVLHQWNLSTKELSILARLGSGSAARSLWSGFVEWHAGEDKNGMDSHGIFMDSEWDELRIGLLLMNKNQKAISSREAMQRTIETSILYKAWPEQVSHDLMLIKKSIEEKDFTTLAQTAETNAMVMHATMQSATPAIFYSQPETLLAMQKIWNLRKEGLPLYFTQDAGPNLKLLFPKDQAPTIKELFPTLQLINPFDNSCHSSESWNPV